MSVLPAFSAKNSTGLAVSFNDRTDWTGGFTADLSISESGAGSLQDWTLSFTFGGDIQQIWGATIESHVGDVYVLGNVSYNASVSATSPAQFGFVASESTATPPTDLVLNAQPLSVTPSPPTATPPVVPPAPSPVTPPAAPPVLPPPPLPSVSVDAANITPASPATDPGTLLPQGFLSTSGGSIVGSGGQAVVINAINWFGMDTGEAAPHGLDTVNYRATMQQMVSLGFNAIRIPFSLASLNPASMPDAINAALNPDLAGLNALGVLDRIVAEAGSLGLKIILDCHNSAGNGGPNADGLWYDNGYSSQDFTNAWVKLAQHYAGNSTVAGFDLSNEPHGQATWGGGNAATDWKMAAQATGDAIQAVNPGALIMVEGVQYNAGIATAWGENLSGVATDPVVLTDPGKLVYSPHVYPTSVTTNPADDATATLAATWAQDWGYIEQNNIAPIFVGEFGATLTNPGDQAWMTTLVQYLAGNASAGSGSAPVPQMPTNWGYWDWNPDSGDTGGILLGDWTSVNQTKIAALAPALWHGPASGAGAGTDAADFALTLSSASASPVTLQLQTVDGTAVAGVNYQPLAETVVIPAGQTTADVSVQLLGMGEGAGSGVFFLQIANSAGATIAVSQASATLPAATTPTPPPTPPSTPPSTLAPPPPVLPTTPIIPPPPPVSVLTAAGEAVATVTSDWGSGLTASVAVDNTGTVGSTGWQVQLSTTEQITNLWNGTILSHVGSVYVVGDAGYNGAIAAGGSATFGFQATHELAGEGLVAQLLKLAT